METTPCTIAEKWFATDYQDRVVLSILIQCYQSASLYVTSMCLLSTTDTRYSQLIILVIHFVSACRSQSKTHNVPEWQDNICEGREQCSFRFTNSGACNSPNGFCEISYNSSTTHSTEYGKHSFKVSKLLGTMQECAAVKRIHLLALAFQA